MNDREKMEVEEKKQKDRVDDDTEEAGSWQAKKQRQVWVKSVRG